ALRIQLSALESVEVIERSPPQTAQLRDGLALDFVTLFLRSEARWPLAAARQLHLLDEQLGIGRRLRVAWQNQPALIDSRNPDVDHLDFCQLLQHRRRRQSRGVQQETLLQRDLQAVGEKGNQNVRVGAVLQLMVNGAYAEFTLERSEDRFDLRQLYVARPQDTGISGGQVGEQQVLSATPFRRLKFFLVHPKLECLPRYLLVFPGHLQVHELEGAAGCRFRGTQAHQQLVAGRKASAHGPQLSE